MLEARRRPTSVETSEAREKQPVKIAYIMSRFPRITETFILYEILELAKCGVSVEIYPLIRERMAVQHPEVTKVMQRVHFHPFLSFPILKANWYYLRGRPMAYLKMVTKVLTRTLGSRRFFLGALGILPKSVRFAYEMEGSGITHVHAHFASHPTLAALIINQLTSIPFSFTAHGSDIHTDQTAFDMKIEAASFAIMISNYNKEFLTKRFGVHIADKMHVIHCGVDTDFFAPGRQKHSPRFQMLCVASFREVKGHRYLLEACTLLLERGVEFLCHLVGDGPLLSQVKRKVSGAGLEKVVCFHGALPRSQVVKMMQSADVAVLPSVLDPRGRREGIPVTLMEAMACGLPVISSDLSGIPELVETGKTGILTRPRDSHAIADALERLSKSPEIRSRMGQAGRENVIKEFNLHKNTAKLAELFCAVQSSPTNPATARRFFSGSVIMRGCPERSVVDFRAPMSLPPDASIHNTRSEPADE